MARHGLLPVVNSFAAFLASRANEQIYNQASEGSKVDLRAALRRAHPGGPGQVAPEHPRHLAARGAPERRDRPAGLVGGDAARSFAGPSQDAEESVAVRLAIGPSPRRIELPERAPAVGRGSVLREGSDAVLISYGPVMLHEALLAAERLAESGEASVRVVAMPWLNRFDADWLDAEVAPFEHVFVLEDHAPVGGLGDGLRGALPGRVVAVFGVEGWPACGTPDEALRFHALDGASLASRIAAHVGVPAR